MTMKKILAGVLAAASVLSVSATAFAAEAPAKTTAVTKPGAFEYEAGVGFLNAELDVELPAQMKAFINPYGAQVAVSEDVTATKNADGILSWAYEVKNNTKDFGIQIDVSNAKATATGIALAATVPATPGAKKTAVVALKSGATADDIRFTDGDADALVFGATAATKKGFANAAPESSVFIGIVGAVKEGTDAGEDEWTGEEAITCTYTLKINPAGAGSTSGGSTVTPGLTADLAQTDFTGTGITAFAKGIANNEYNMTIDTSTNGGSAIGLNLTSLVDGSQTITSKVADNANVAVAGMGMNVNITPANTGSSVVTITLSDNNTIIINLTLT